MVPEGVWAEKFDENFYFRFVEPSRGIKFADLNYVYLSGVDGGGSLIICRSMAHLGVEGKNLLTVPSTGHNKLMFYVCSAIRRSK